MTASYTAQLGAGLGMVTETRVLLDIWQPGMDLQALQDAALQSGRLRNMTARRLHNFAEECFKPRYLVNSGRPAKLLKALQGRLGAREFEQVLFIFTCRANLILADFVREVYWGAYAAGRGTLSNEEARAWVTRANRDGKMTKPWSDTVVLRVARYLTGCCADFGLLEGTKSGTRKILPYRIEPRVAAILAYDLHLSGLGDNSVIGHGEWALFGLEPQDALAELKRLALQGLVIAQTAGTATRISWTYKTMEDLINVLA